MEAEKSAGKRLRTNYDAAFRAEAVRRVTQEGQAATRVAQALGMSKALLGRWVRAARAQAARPAGSEVLEQENKQLRAQVARAEMGRDSLKKALTIGMLEPHYHTRRADETLRFHCLTRCLLARAAAMPSTGRQCQRLLRLAEAPASSRRASAARLASSGLARVYDPRRTLRPTPTPGSTAPRRLRRGSAAFTRLAQQQRLTRPLHPRQYPATRPPRTTQADPQAVAAANKLATWPTATAPNHIWVGDITYLALATEQWAYLACWRDAFSRRVVGWHVRESMHTALILNAFNRAVAVCQPPPGLLVHADRGSQYTSEAFTTLLDHTQAIASLSRPGDPYDNALAESG